MLPSMIQFARPLVLIGLPLAAGLGWWRRRRRGTALGPRPQPLRWTAAGLLVIALAAPELRCGREPSAVVLLDASASQGRAADGQGDVPDGWQLQRIRFAAGVETPGAPLDRTATALAPPLELLAALTPAPTAAIIVTDGRFTDAESLEPLLKRVAARGTAFLWVPRAGEGADARVAGMTGTVGAGGRVDLTVTVQADAAMTRTLTVGWNTDSTPIEIRQLPLEPGKPATVDLTAAPAEGQPLWLWAELVEDDLLTANNRMVLPVRSPTPTVLALAPQGAVVPAVPAGWAVHPAGFEAAPAEASALLAYDAVAVVDASGEALSAEQRAALAGYVKLGG
ncbi:MAG: hypothetical protein GX591_18790, partial [Planctomycetes bacterium]|nr:hypothetical protein [Planctomycetota bacterium]